MTKAVKILYARVATREVALALDRTIIPTVMQAERA